MKKEYAKIAIRGSKIGTDVIKHLENLGGINSQVYKGTSDEYYYINQEGHIDFSPVSCDFVDYKILETVPLNTKKTYELWEK